MGRCPEQTAGGNQNRKDSCNDGAAAEPLAASASACGPTASSRLGALVLLRALALARPHFLATSLLSAQVSSILLLIDPL
jgi:hypothetical protein